MTAIPAPSRLRQGNHSKFKANLGYKQTVQSNLDRTLSLGVVQIKGIQSSLKLTAVCDSIMDRLRMKFIQNIMALKTNRQQRMLAWPKSSWLVYSSVALECLPQETSAQHRVRNPSFHLQPFPSTIDHSAREATSPLT